MSDLSIRRNQLRVDSAIRTVNKLETVEEISRVFEACHARRDVLSKALMREFRIGDPVTFTHHRTQETMRGVVEKILIKRIAVTVTDGARWRVPPEHLTLDARPAEGG